MESQPQNPEFRNKPENFHPCILFKEFFGTVARINASIILYNNDLYNS